MSKNSGEPNMASCSRPTLTVATASAGRRNCSNRTTGKTALEPKQKFGLFSDLTSWHSAVKLCSMHSTLNKHQTPILPRLQSWRRSPPLCQQLSRVAKRSKVISRSPLSLAPRPGNGGKNRRESGLIKSTLHFWKMSGLAVLTLILRHVKRSQNVLPRLQSAWTTKNKRSQISSAEGRWAL